MFKHFLANRLTRLTAIAVSLVAFLSIAQAASAAGGQPNQLAAALASGKLDEQVVNELRTSGSADVIVSFKSKDVLEQARAKAPSGKDRFKAIIDEAKRGFAVKKGRALAPLGPEALLLRDYDALPSSFVRVDTEEALLALVQSDDVRRVNTNRRYTAMLNQSLPLIHQSTAASFGFTGEGATVAVLDTGVDYTQAAFGDCSDGPNTRSCRVIAAREEAADDGSLDDTGHGTNVAGIVAGVAPGASILALDVFKGASAFDSDVQDGINWVINRKGNGEPVTAINLSLGDTGLNTSTCDDSSYADAFMTAREVDILPVVAAGNAANTGSGYRDGLADPACAPGAIPVGAVSDGNLGSRTWFGCTDSTTAATRATCFSQGGRNLRIVAPGAVIAAAGQTWTGTSQAAPHVAGATAVLGAMRTATGRVPLDLEIVAALESGPTINDSRSGVTRTLRRLDLAAAVDKLLGLPGWYPQDAKPSLSAPTQSIASASSARISWSGGDTLSGIASFTLEKKVDGGSWTNVPLASPTSMSATVAVQAGHSYEFSVTAVDLAGNSSGWKYGPRFTVRLFDSAGSSIAYAGSWSTWATSSPSPYIGASTKYTTQAGSTATLAFTGRNVAWFGQRSSWAGTAEVFVDDVSVARRSQFSTTSSGGPASLIYEKPWTSSGAHRIRIRAEGTSGFTDVDAFVVYQ